MRRQNQKRLTLTSLSHQVIGVIKTYYPWLLVVAIAYLFFFPPSLFVSNASKPNTVIKTVLQKEKIFYSKHPKILVFIADKNNKGKGKLTAINTNDAKIDGEFLAVSGVGGRENQPRSGVIPSNRNTRIISYTVDLNPLTLSNPGIAGKFYKINPHWVDINGVRRGDFGIHADRNVPGTAGCIGIESEAEWKAFKLLMANYRDAGLTQIPLLVAYR